MKPIPTTKEDVRLILRDLADRRDLWHIDDDPFEIFDHDEAVWRAALVRAMERLWDPNAGEEDCILASAWAAFEECCPEYFDVGNWNA